MRRRTDSSGSRSSIKKRSIKYPLFTKGKIKIEQGKKDPIPVRTFYKLLTRNTMRFTKSQINDLPKVSAQDPRAKLKKGSIILHYLPKNFGYFGPMNDPRKFSAANHCSIVTLDKEITHAILPGVRSDPITQFYWQGQYGVIFRIDEKYDPYGHAGLYASQQAREFRELTYSNAGALGLQVRVALKAFGPAWMSVKPNFGTNSANRRREYLKKLKIKREEKIKKRFDYAPKSTLARNPLWNKQDQGKKYKREYDDEPEFFCSEFVVMCYQLTLHTHDARFPDIDAHNSTPDNVEHALIEHPMWNPVAIIEP